MTFTPGAVRHGVGARPEGMVDGLSGLRMARLPQKLWPAVAPSEPQDCPRRSITGATPESQRRSSTVVHRSLTVPMAAVRRAASTGPAPGREAHRGSVLMRATPRLNLLGTRADGLNGGLHRGAKALIMSPEACITA